MDEDGRFRGDQICEGLDPEDDDYEREYVKILAAIDATVVVHTDSQLVQRQLSGEWAVRDKGLRALHARAREAAGAFASVGYMHVRRGHNARADALANDAIDHARDFLRVYEWADGDGL